MDIHKKIDDLQNANHKLLLIIGKPGSGKSRVIREYSEETGIPIVDLDTIFAHTPPENLMHEMHDFLKEYRRKVLLLDNKTILYTKNSSIDLLAFLKEICKTVTVVSTWNGKIEDGQLFHFNKEAPEDLIYSIDKEECKYVLC